MNLKNRVRQLREEQGLTQKQLGEKVNVDRSIEEVFDFKESERK